MVDLQTVPAKPIKVPQFNKYPKIRVPDVLTAVPEVTVVMTIETSNPRGVGVTSQFDSDAAATDLDSETESFSTNNQSMRLTPGESVQPFPWRANKIAPECGQVTRQQSNQFLSLSEPNPHPKQEILNQHYPLHSRTIDETFDALSFPPDTPYQAASEQSFAARVTNSVEYYRPQVQTPPHEPTSTLPGRTMCTEFGTHDWVDFDSQVGASG